MTTTSSKARPAASFLLAAGLVFGLSGCGGGDDATPTTTPETPAATAEAPEETTGDDAEETIEELTDAAGQTADATDDGADSTGTGGDYAEGVPPLPEIWPDVQASLDEAEAVTATLSGDLEGSDMTMELEGKSDDSEYVIEMTMDDMSVAMLTVDGTFYMKSDEAFWMDSGLTQDQAAMMADRWIEVPEDEAPAGLGIGFLFEEFSMLEPSESDMDGASGVMDEVDGREAYHYTLANGSQIWIAADDSAELLRMSADEGGETMEIVIHDWDAEPVEAPEDAVSIEELMSGG
ncbi:hypothetical protein [Ornithinimicrobium sp. Y1694]|uniref:hypothetical protein n=1 Tax=Ornithinimicrobium sp. Y1694 TaxID=3418590 RepID=UPI003CF93B57